MKNLAWANFVLGIWLIVAPFVLLYRGIQAALGEDVVVGFLIAVFSLWQAIAAQTAQSRAANWIVGALGLWAIVSLYVLHFTAITKALVNNVIVGAVVAILAIWLTADFGRHDRVR